MWQPIAACLFVATGIPDNSHEKSILGANKPLTIHYRCSQARLACRASNYLPKMDRTVQAKCLFEMRRKNVQPPHIGGFEMSVLPGFFAALPNADK